MGTNELLDLMCGGKQSQLVVLNPKNIDILPQTLAEHCQNKALSIKQTFKEYPFEMTINHWAAE